MERVTENKSAAVPEEAKQAEEMHPRWGWTEPAVWTARMLTALEEGLKGGVWFSLMDKVYAERNLQAAFRKVAKNRGAAGVDHETIEKFEAKLEDNITRLAKSLRERTYHPQAIKRVYIPKPGSKEKRPLGIPTVRDRVVQTALRSVIEPIFERDFAEHSYGFRPGRGCKDALREVVKLLKAGYVHVVDADLKSYFDTIPHQRLMKLVSQKVADGKVLVLIEQFLKQGVFEDVKTWIPEDGTPQGGVISPLLSNIYLNDLDHQMAQAGYAMVRYADDFVVMCRTEEEAQAAMKQVQEWTVENELELHPTKTRTLHAQTDAFEFLGYSFTKGKRFPRQKSLKKLKDAVRANTRRANGHSLELIIVNLNSKLRGWFEYFKHSYRTTFPRLDSWIRMRLRSILRKRIKRKGRGRGNDHQRWPNAFFQEQGLFSLVAARALACQPLKG
jgi:RNA-directed DNA polymerase